MAMNSVANTSGATVALLMMNIAGEQARTVQDRIFTELKTPAPKEKDPVQSVAVQTSADAAGSDPVRDANRRGQSTVDAAVSAGAQVADLLNQMKAKALAASDVGLDSDSRDKLAKDFTALQDKVAGALSNASFGGSNLLLAPSGAGETTSGGPVTSFAASGDLSSPANATRMVGEVKASQSRVNAAVEGLNAESRALQAGDAQDALASGVGRRVDPRLGKDGAGVQAQQAGQQLASQAVAIANSAPGVLVGLFRG